MSDRIDTLLDEQRTSPPPPAFRTRPHGERRDGGMYEGAPQDLKGQAIAAFVTLKEGHKTNDALRDESRPTSRRTTTLADPAVVAKLKDMYEAQES